MKYIVMVAGKPSLSYAKSGVEEYLKRLKRYGNVQVKYLKAGSSERVSKDLLQHSKGTFRVALDERGMMWDTRMFTEKVSDWEMRGDIKAVSFLLGASDGHTKELRDHADLVLGLSPLTYQHELALVVLLEQLYRVQTLKRGEPYHR